MIRRLAPAAATAVRRCIDVVVAGAALLVLSPVLLVVAILVRLRLGSPVLFRQARSGRGGVPFELVKFRSMRDAEPGREAPEFDEERLGSFGRFLRSSSLDELPELLLVLRGPMSLVGPRPLPVAYLRRYSDRQSRRLEVKPGITGWAQVNGRNATTWDERFEQDVWYVEHRSLRLDLAILARTVRAVVKREGVDHAPGVTMTEFRGPGS